MKELKPLFLGWTTGTERDPFRVYLEWHHTVVTGLTRKAGKTTTLKALLSRAAEQEMRGVMFITKRGEIPYDGAHVHLPYYRERSDWQYVQSILEAAMDTKLKFEESWIIKVAKGTRSLRQVLANVEKALETARGIHEGVYTRLKAYLEIVIPQIEGNRFAKELRLKPGLNVFDLRNLSDEMQSLVIASTIEFIHEYESRTVTVIPEAWKQIPEGRRTPVRLVLEPLVREGGAVFNYVWVDSQDITGVEKKILKQFLNWVLGIQLETNEVQRTLDQVPVAKGLKPKAEEIAQLPIGHFYVTVENRTHRVYVQPEWLPEKVAIEIARSGNVGLAAKYAPHSKKEEKDDMTKAEVERLERENEKLQKANTELQGRVDALETRLNAVVGLGELKQAVEKTGKKAPLPPPPLIGKPVNPTDSGNGKHTHLEVERDVPCLVVHEQLVTIRASDRDLEGKIALLLADGFFDSSRANEEVVKELASRGQGNYASGGGRVQVRNAVKQVAGYGFIRIENERYLGIPEAKKRVRRIKEAVEV